MIDLVGLGVTLGGTEVLRGLTCTFQPGVTALLGRNGAGKTTLIRTLAGLVPTTSGAVLLDGESPFGDEAASRGYRSRLGWMPQEPVFPGRVRVLDAVMYAAWLAGARPEREHAEASLRRVALSGDRRRRVGAMSGGQRRRLALACATVSNPSVLLLDEPTVGLDPEQRERFLSSITGAGPGNIVLLSTHLMEDVLAVADRVVVLDSGSITIDTELAALRSGDTPDAGALMARLRRAVIDGNQ